MGIDAGIGALIDLVRGGVRLAGPGVEVVSSKVLAAAGDYAAEDVLSENATDGLGTAFRFSGAARKPGGSGTITKAQAFLTTTALTPRIRLYLFKRPPNSEKDDNAANTAVSTADRIISVGHLDFSAMADLEGTSEALLTPTADGMPLEFDCADGEDSLYGIAVTQDAITGEVAGMELMIKLFVRQG